MSSFAVLLSSIQFKIGFSSRFNQCIIFLHIYFFSFIKPVLSKFIIFKYNWHFFLLSSLLFVEVTQVIFISYEESYNPHSFFIYFSIFNNIIIRFPIQPIMPHFVIKPSSSLIMISKQHDFESIHPLTIPVSLPNFLSFKTKTPNLPKYTCSLGTSIHTLPFLLFSVRLTIQVYSLTSTSHKCLEWNMMTIFHCLRIVTWVLYIFVLFRRYVLQEVMHKELQLTFHSLSLGME